MRTHRLLLLVLLLCAALTLTGARRRAVGPGTPPVPGPCVVQGLPNFYYSTDGGAHWSLNAAEPTAAGAWDLAVFPGAPETLLAAVGRNVLDSADGGCTWTLRHTVTEDIHHNIHLVAGPAGRAFLWTEEFVLRYDRGTVVPIAIPATIGGLGIDPANADHVRILDLSTGVPRESFDSGATWQVAGKSPGGHINGTAFDPTDFNHILAGVQNSELRITRDGGQTWSSGAKVGFVCNLAFVSTQPNIVWIALPTGSSAAYIQRSSDGGVHLDPVSGLAGVENGVCLHLQINPHDPNVAHTLFGGDLHQFDAVLKTVTTSNCCGGRIDLLTYSPNDPSRAYLFSAKR